MRRVAGCCRCLQMDIDGGMDFIGGCVIRGNAISDLIDLHGVSQGDFVQAVL